MNVKMNHIEAYAKAQHAKRISKRIQQLSWALNKLEQRFDLEELEGNDIIKLTEAYLQAFRELIEITNELKTVYEDANYSDKILGR